MLLVVFYHSILFWKGNWFTQDPAATSKVLTVISDWLNSFHIYGFALVSGYLFYYIKYEKGGYQKFGPFVVTKAKRLLVPYAVVALVWVIPIQWAFFRYDWWTVVKNFAFAVSPNQLWFLVMLFDVFVIFWLLSDFFQKNTLLGLLTVVGMYGVSVVGSGIIPNIFMIWRAFAYMPFFWLGFKLRQHGTAYIRKIPSIVWIALHALFFAATQFLGCYDGLVFKLANLAAGFLTCVIGAIMAFAVLQNIADKVRWNGKAFKFLSARSMAVYLFHQQAIYFFIYWLNGVVNPYLNAAINFIGAMALSLAIATVLLKFKTTRFLIGEK